MRRSESFGVIQESLHLTVPADSPGSMSTLNRSRSVRLGRPLRLYKAHPKKRRYTCGSVSLWKDTGVRLSGQRTQSIPLLCSRAYLQSRGGLALYGNCLYEAWPCHIRQQPDTGHGIAIYGNCQCGAWPCHRWQLPDARHGGLLWERVERPHEGQS